MKNPRFALEFQLTQIAQKFMKVGSALPPPSKKPQWPVHSLACACRRVGRSVRWASPCRRPPRKRRRPRCVSKQSIDQPTNLLGGGLKPYTLFASKPQMKLRTNDVGNLVKQGFDQLAAANALEITDNDFVRTRAPLQHTPMPCSDPWVCTRILYDYAGQGYQAPQLAGRAHRHCRAQLVRRYA